MGFFKSLFYGRKNPKTFVDPVCDMSVVPEHALGPIEFDHRRFYFCSEKCLNKFRQNPGKWAVGHDGHT